MTQYHYPATVLAITDGDTVKLDVQLVDADLGFHLWAHEHMPLKFRLYGTNSPPGKTPEGKAATAFLTGLIPVGTQVEIDSLRNTAGADMPYKYGDEWMAIIWLPGGVYSVNDQMIASGNAVAWDGRGPRPGG